jgi:hypothetical protein
MEFLALAGTRQQVRYIGTAVYSLLVLATTVPALRIIPHTIIIPYFVIVPGYCMTFLLNRSASIVDRLFYALAWSIALLTAVVSLETFNAGLPLSVVVPGVTLIVLGYNYLHDG